MSLAFSLKGKLLLLTTVLVLAPMGILGVYSYWQFNGFADAAVGEASEALEVKAQELLTLGAEADADRVQAMIGNAEDHVRMLSTSGNMVGYLAARAGKNEQLNALIRKEVFRAAEGIMAACQAQHSTAAGGDAEALVKARAAVAQQVVGIKIGQTGYPFVMDSQGVLQVHPKETLVGKNTITDLKLTSFQGVLDSKKSGQVQLLNYAFEGREKFLAYTWFQPWDWVICVSGYWDEMSAEAATFALELLKKDIESFHRSSTVQVHGKRVPTYSQIRFLGADGKEVVNLQDGKFAAKLGERSSADWFKGSVALASGQVYNSGTSIAANTGGEEMRIAAPVYLGDTLQGVFVVNINWGLVWEQLKDRVYGKTGYPYLVNEKGVLISHPKYSLKDSVNITDAKYGPLAGLVQTRMLKGQTGVDKYTFEGVDKYVAYRPIQAGQYQYAIGVTEPCSELLEAAEHIRSQADEKASASLLIMTGLTAALSVLGAMAGLLCSNRIVKPLRRIIDGLAGGAEQTASASTQVSGASQSLAEGSSEQAAALEETTASVEEMASMIKQNAGNANEAKALADETNGNASRGAQAMQRMSTAIDEIKKSSDETARILKTIDEIAFQTNLLALNAAVEAARAGEAGKGFAVVAEEVRNLAQRSAEAARNTANLIEQSVKSSDNGVAISREVGESLDAISQAAGKLNSLVAEVAAASNEQAQGIEQINGAIGQMDQVTQNVASNAEQSASAAEELSAQASELNGMVRQLRNLVDGARTQEAQASFAADQRPGPQKRKAARAPGAPAHAHPAARPEPAATGEESLMKF